MSITGNLRTLEFAELLQWLAQGQKTGALVVKSGAAEKRIYFKGGRIISSQSNDPAEHLGSFMVREGLLDEDTLARALKLQESTQILLGKVLVTLGTISEDELNRVLKRKTEESLFELFNWIEGEFHFLPDDLPKLPMVPIEIDVTNIVLEGAKRFDEARRDGKVGGNDLDQEIDNVLSADIFQGVNLDKGESDPDSVEVSLTGNETEDSSAGLALSDLELDVEKEEPTDVRAYYSGAGKKSVAKSLLAAAAAIAVIAIGVTAYFLMPTDPAAGTADRESLERAIPPASVTATDDLFQTMVPESGPVDPPISTAAAEPAPEEPEGPDESEQMQARYEEELQTLKQQLRQAQLVAAERDDAMDKIAQLEEQVAEAQEAAAVPEPADPPQSQFTLARFTEPLDGVSLSAGGDEAPPLGSPLPATEADQEAGTDFATEMVEAAPSPPILEANTGTPLSLEEPVVEPVVEESDPLIKAPVLLSRPKPRYPAAAMRLGKEAVVTLRLLIDARGKVVDVERLGSDPGMGFNKAAVNAALATSWEPATADGNPIEMWAEMRIAFKP